MGNDVTLVAVSKMKSVADILQLYEMGHRDFGENYVQELIEKKDLLPADINWHFIGHLQSNKVKLIATFIYLIHSVDSPKLLQEISRQGANHQRVINCLVQVHVAQEETKFGFDPLTLSELFNQLKEWQATGKPHFVRIKGLMGMASFTDDQEILKNEFRQLHELYNSLKEHSLPAAEINILSMGMSNDYLLAVSGGSTMVRIGSLLFGNR